jgi:ArsR family transcriptional regulator, arsenate/arsenite/antimonite-responsive transcriptional repressor
MPNKTLTIIDAFRYTLGMDTTTTRSLPVREAEPAEPCCEAAVALPVSDPVRTDALADRLKALADPTRLRLLDLLVAQQEPLCVCEITEQFAQQQPTISHHLRILRQAGLIAGEKRGVWSYYWATEAGRRSVSLVKTLL